MPDRAVYLTREGFKRLDEELEHLRTVKRPEVSERIRRSKDMTDVVDNAEYDTERATGVALLRTLVDAARDHVTR